MWGVFGPSTRPRAPTGTGFARAAWERTGGAKVRQNAIGVSQNVLKRAQRESKWLQRPHFDPALGHFESFGLLLSPFEPSLTHADGILAHFGPSRPLPSGTRAKPVLVGARGRALAPKILSTLPHAFQIWQQMGPLGPFVAKFGPWRPKGRKSMASLRPCGVFSSSFRSAVFWQCLFCHLLLFWPILSHFGPF